MVPLTVSLSLSLIEDDTAPDPVLSVRTTQHQTQSSEWYGTTDCLSLSVSHRGRHSTRPSPLSDNLFRPRDRAITGKEMQLRTRQNYKNLPEVRRKQEEEKRREDYLTNRLRADLFKKKLLDEILQRGSH
ncbi:(E2-independent) E3 ubiquitin-conjugating enzyme FATS-like [Salmo trutta]|uniref:(E2-independent) E3 ubiquitin-conjugating enzyme FATS-like n=1 Tax=Salmo trutta TaxID=8032 RepID=UPI0011306C01|nr:(E2-independent) E3 ubiquitin-conjugating enzyme FATS-like [Salmo trutta]XP_029599316.1 (E2-independent) E3 ubiquitin-conjugating enzyme FATS-like [Salmo trutta]